MAIKPGYGKIGTAGFDGRIKTAAFHYDFAVDGGAVSAIDLRGDSLPAGAIITDALVYVDTALDSAADTATVALAIDGQALDAAQVITSVYNAEGVSRIDHATPDIITLATSDVVTATVAVQALTAGAFRVILFYVEVA